MHAPRNPLATALLSFCIVHCALCIASAAPPLEWRADLASSEVANLYARHGDAAPIALRLALRGAPYAAESALCHYQTNGMGAAWWEAPASLSSNVVTIDWGPALDPGADLVTLLVEIDGAHRAAALLHLRPGPGGDIAPLPPPTQTLDFAAIAYTNAPWATPAEVASAIAAATNSIVVPDLSAYATTSYVAEAVAAVPVPDLSGKRDYLDLSYDAPSFPADGTGLFRLTGQDGTTYTLRPFSSGGFTGWSTSGTYVVPYVLKLGTAPDFYYRLGVPPGDSLSMHVLSPDTPSETFADGHGNVWTIVGLAQEDGIALRSALSAYATTNALRSGLAAKADTSALSAYATTAALNTALSSKADRADIPGWIDSTNAWLAVEDGTLSLYEQAPTNAAPALLWESGHGIDPEATNLLWRALGSVQRSWGDYTADGAANPDGTAVVLNRASAVLAPGFTLSACGAFSVLSASGAVSYIEAAGSSARWAIDSTNYVGFAQGGTITVGATVGGIAVEDGAAPGAVNITLEFPYSSGGHPLVWYAPALAGEWQEIDPAAIVWVDDSATSSGTFSVTGASGFFKGTTTREMGATFRVTPPIDLMGGVAVPNVPDPVVYDAVITIQSGGHTYRIPAQLVQ